MSLRPITLIVAFLIAAILLEVVGGVNLQEIFDFSDPDIQEFSNLINRHRFKLLDKDDAHKRLGYFRKNKEALKRFHDKHKNAKFILNKFSLLSKEEKQKHFGAVLSKKRGNRNALDNTIASFAPASFDFRTYEKVTPIKNQAKCGSCWAFSSAAAIESQYLLRQNKSLDLSEQYLVNCNTDALKCNGGDVINAIEFVKTNGIAIESCLPYNGSNGTCSITQCNSEKYKIDGFHDFGTDESTFATKLYNYGPATVIIYVPEEFMSYSSGIFDMPAAECMQDNLGLHAMVIVGFTQDYWIIRNSWDLDWGEQGYVRVKRGQNFCSMTLEVVAPYLNVSTSSATTTVKGGSATTVAAKTTTIKGAAATTATTKTTTTTTAPFVPTNKCPIGDGKTIINESQRTNALKLFNSKRSEIAKGLFKMSNNATAPAAKNMKKLVYNCTLESVAQKYADTCTKTILPNSYSSALGYPYKISIDAALNDSLSHLFSFSVIKQNDSAVASSGNTTFAFDDAVSIGCAFSTKACFSSTTKAVLICSVTPFQPPSSPAYTIGAACTGNSQCTKIGYNKCDISLGLCYS